MNCRRCNGAGRVFGSRWFHSGVMDNCPACNPEPKLPEWMRPVGHSQVVGPRTNGGGEDEGVKRATHEGTAV